MSFSANLKRLCNQNGTSLTRMMKELGFSTSKATAINRGQIPNNEETLLKMAQFLNCSVMDFFEEDVRTPVQPQDEDEKDILRIYRSLSRRSKHEFMSMVYEFENRRELEGDKEEVV